MVNHVERVAYIAYKMYNHGNIEYKIDFNKFFILSNSITSTLLEKRI